MLRIAIALGFVVSLFSITGMCCGMVDCPAGEEMIDADEPCPEGKSCYETNCGAAQCVTDPSEDGGSN